jgi:hypothetical protein
MFRTSYLLFIATLIISCAPASNDRTAGAGGDRGTEYCGEALGNYNTEKCLPRLDWTILAAREDFPENISLRINDECSGNESPFTIARKDTIVLEALRFIYLSGPLKLEIFNLGNACNQKLKFYVDPNQDFKLDTTALNKTLEINI